jgi:hypothetical protein
MKAIRQEEAMQPLIQRPPNLIEDLIKRVPRPKLKVPPQQINAGPKTILIRHHILLVIPPDDPDIMVAGFTHNHLRLLRPIQLDTTKEFEACILLDVE